MKKLLIANRGEIARRIIRTARDLGIDTIAIYSDIDTSSPHVQEATEAYRLPGLTPGETYLDMDAILQIGVDSGADAVHPGYGFLSENGHFARACDEAGLTFVGPSPESITALGSKINARAIAIENDVPVMPGTTEGVKSLEEAKTTADKIGYPVLLKAAAGGGGKGMRIVRDKDDLERGLKAARGEAMTAFGDDEVFVEKYIENPRHIEIQVVADASGNVVVLGERECSIQRRHQKLVEESPSAAVDSSLRTRMAEAAERLVSGAGYVNAGTLEFLLAPDGQFYFLEVNTRLQVEHPVTELITGVDIVEMQLSVARGERLQMTTADVKRDGHAIECRICAEDPYDGFLPSVGRIHEATEPGGHHVRVDSGMYAGMEVSLYYDPMLAKLICWGQDRPAAIARTIEALDEYHIAGVATTIPFCRYVLRHDEFVSGDYSTAFVDRNWNGKETTIPPNIIRSAVAAAAMTDVDVKKRLYS